MKYNIPDYFSLREVYLMWLIVIDNKDFERENNLNSGQLMAFRTATQYTWGQFRAKSNIRGVK